MYIVAEPQTDSIGIGAEVHKIKLPLIGNVRRLQDALNKAGVDESQVVGVVTGFFEELGLPREAIDKIPFSEFTSVLTYICDQSKKKSPTTGSK